jgi:hypothetical protein
MKFALLLCTLILSLHGWGASVISSPRTAPAIVPNHQAAENAKLQEGGSRSLQVDKMTTAIISGGLIIYLAAIFWWVMAAKNSLDSILKDVLQDMALYS